MRTGHKLIYTTSFGFMDATVKVAKKYPNVLFEHATGYKRDKNLATYSGRFYEGRYVQGQIAAKMSKTGIVGYIGSFPIPEVVSGINAMMLGVQSVRPDMKIKIIWVNSWYDPGKEAAAARGARRSGRRHSHPAHRLARPRCSSPTSAAFLRVRSGLRHDQVRAEGAAHRASSTTGRRTTSTAPSSRSTASGRPATCGAGSTATS